MNSEQDSGIIMENGSNNHNNNNTLDNFENDFYGGVRSKSNLSSGDEVKKSPNTLRRGANRFRSMRVKKTASSTSKAPEISVSMENHSTLSTSTPDSERAKRKAEKEARRQAKAERHAARERERQRHSQLQVQSSNPTESNLSSAVDAGSTLSLNSFKEDEIISQEKSKSYKKIEKLQARVSELNSDMQERGEQIFKLRSENRNLQIKLDEAAEAINNEKQLHEKILNDIQARNSRQIESGKREIKLELEQAEETIAQLNQKLENLTTEKSSAQKLSKKYKSEVEKLSARFNTTSQSLLDMSAQCKRLTEAAVKNEKSNKHNMEQQHENHVKNAELIENYEKKIYDLKLALDAAKNDGSLQSEINWLRQQKTDLAAENDDLKGQLMNLKMNKEQASRDSLHDTSLQAEIEREMNSGKKSSRATQKKIEELTSSYLKEKKAHKELKIYMDKILANIMEKDPSILEV